ncbi:MAG: DUF1549 and DUF1553 domain-containing protein [Planctomycetota bacterium]
MNTNQTGTRNVFFPLLIAAAITVLIAPAILAGDAPATGTNPAIGAILEDADVNGTTSVVAESGSPAAEAVLNVYPSNIDLTSARDYQSLVAQLTYADGVTVDVTGQAAWSVANPELARISGNKVFPVADGETQVVIQFENHSIQVPVKITGAVVRPPLSFKNDVMPVFSKAGCNAGSCHGAARGKDGFQLSLYGFDPDGDYHRLTREQPGRRIDLGVPENCLLITKATGAVPHTGEQLFDPGSEYYATLIEWLQDGAPNDPGEVPTVTSIELYPPGGLFNGPDVQQQMTVVANYSDGTNRDVTSLAYFSTSNDNSAAVSQEGVVTSFNRGESFVMARFDTHTVGVDFISLPANLEFQWNDIPENNYIDTLINNKLRNLRINPSEVCSDAEFIRRVSLDICGASPSADEVREFLASEDENKRAQLVDRLLERKEFVELWVMKWSELLQIRSTQQVSYKATLLYYNWLQQQISDEVPIDQMVNSLLSSQGGTFTNPSTNYYQIEREQLKVAENVAQVFMGMRIQCAQCHNHPFDRWTMDDYYGFAAFFAQIGRKPAEDPREQIIYNRGRGETAHPVTNQNMTPKFLGGDTPDVRGKDRRAVMADWLVSDENPYFSRNMANIVWSHFFGQGIVHEVDDVRVSNPPVNAELLDELGQKFVEYRYDFKKMVRDICNSRTYQLSTVTNETNESDLTNFSHSSLRRIRAEIMLDVISQITETENKFRGLPLGSRAVQIADGNTSSYFLNTFGRASRETVCSCEVKAEPNLSQALHLLNGDAVHNKIRQGNLIGRLLEEERTSEQIIRELFLRCLAREPNENELNGLLAEIDQLEDKKTALEDVFWALLNSREFVFNH